MAGADLFTLVWHELGHAMGIGTQWDAFGYLVDGGTADPRYNGAGALDEYSTLLGVPAVSIPVANQGGPGTRDSHWRENVFSTEIMTGFLNFGVTNAISRMTLMSLFDVGWSVNLPAAGAYSLPACAGAVCPSSAATSSGYGGMGGGSGCSGWHSAAGGAQVWSEEDYQVISATSDHGCSMDDHLRTMGVAVSLEPVLLNRVRPLAYRVSATRRSCYCLPGRTSERHRA